MRSLDTYIVREQKGDSKMYNRLILIILFLISVVFSTSELSASTNKQLAVMFYNVKPALNSPMSAAECQKAADNYRFMYDSNKSQITPMSDGRFDQFKIINFMTLSDSSYMVILNISEHYILNNKKYDTNTNFAILKDRSKFLKGLWNNQYCRGAIVIAPEYPNADINKLN